MAGCDKKNLVPSRSLVTRDLGTRFGQITRARVTEKRGKNCYALRLFSGFCISKNLDVFHFYARAKRVN